MASGPRGSSKPSSVASAGRAARGRDVAGVDDAKALRLSELIIVSI
jgi:hypothetical protein